jgi:hypothetical protein
VQSYTLLIISGGWVFLNRPTKINSNDTGEFTPVIDSSLSKKYAPVFISNKDNGLPYKLYYRAATDKNGNTYIAYHPVWNNELNKSSGFMPFLNRTLYTGGLKLQKLMFGKEDIESVMYKIDSTGKIVEIDYETAAGYDPKGFSVSHKNVKVTEPLDTPGYFKVISWNHLFEYQKSFEDKNDGYQAVTLAPEYFTQKDWEAYEIFKEKETILKKNRAHFIFERKTAEL